MRDKGIYLNREGPALLLLAIYKEKKANT